MSHWAAPSPDDELDLVSSTGAAQTPACVVGCDSSLADHIVVGRASSVRQQCCTVPLEHMGDLGPLQFTRWEDYLLTRIQKDESQPHHILLVADPQLVDPHTYPGRPWPLSSLTIIYTDLYLRRSYRHLQQRLVPDSTLFLGDLFDGGREWATAKTRSPEKRYKKYGTDFWKREYTRFAELFLRGWMYGYEASAAAPMGRRLIASVPGNHDLGFASGIQPAVKSRFDAHFGPLNRVDILGNHSIVSLDTVSLSAMDQVDPKTGSSGAGDGSAVATANSHLWKPVEDFLTNARPQRQRAIQHEYRQLRSLPQTGSKALGFLPFVPEAKDLQDAYPAERTFDRLPTIPSSQFPTIVLSHVPLYRPAGTPCGPLREGRPSISLTAGYQYQNALTPLISQDIIKHLVPEEVVMIYSGDDHDYCEIEHNEFTGRIKEITVKSMSWAMGVRKPGVQLLSLWNPLDLESLVSDTPLHTPKDTIQNRLCLLPDQLSIFIRYGQLLILTLVVLAVSSVRSKHSTSDYDYERSEPVLPLHKESPSSQTSSVSSSEAGHLQTNLKTRNSKLGGYGNIPVSSRSSSPSKPGSSAIPDPFAPAAHTYLVDSATGTNHVRGKDSDDWGAPHSQRGRQSSRRPPSNLRAFANNIRDVTVPVLLFYFWLLFNDR
jgi:ethanolamine phosphate phosphodiesterase